MLDTFKNFVADKKAWDMYITGAAGTGKTTGLRVAVEHCIALDIPHVVCAFTHKACDILRSKLPEEANVQTLHKFLKKRPGINQSATNKRHVDINVKQGASERMHIMFIDEYSMVGEKDGMDIRMEQDSDYDGVPGMKVVWIGDPNQLPPVGDQAFVKPSGRYQVVLTKIHRQAADNPLLAPLSKLVGMIQGTTSLAPLQPNPCFIRGVDIVDKYLQCHEDKVLLAFTNQRVQELNSCIQGYESPITNDALFSPTTKKKYTFSAWVNDVTYIDLPFNGELHLDSKYKTLEHLIDADLCAFAEVTDEEDYLLTVGVIFGHYNYKVAQDQLKTAAAASNRAIEDSHPGHKAAGWAKANWKHPLARARAKAWRDYMSFNDCVICLDFPHATTVHKSQGSTYNTVFVDSDDLYKCAEINMTQYLRLMYVAISRASNKVYTN